MADRVLAGEAPPQDVSGYPPGTIWMQIVQRASNPAGLTFGVDLWCSNMAQYVGVNLAGPEQNMAGGPWLWQQYPEAWEIDPVEDGAVGKIMVEDFTVSQPNFYHIEAQCADVREHHDVQLGVPGVAQIGRTIDSRLAYDKTPQGRQEKLRREAQDMARPTGNIGRSSSRLRRVPRTP